MKEDKDVWQRVSRRKVYDNPWIELYHDEVKNPNGGEGIYGVVHFKNIAIGIIPIDENDCTWLVGQHRYPLNEYSWEIPEGGGPLGIDPLESAKRELLEETGLQADHWEIIQHSDLSNSVSDEKAIIYLAGGLHQGKAQPENTEKLSVRYLSVNEAIEMVNRGEITDSLSVIGLLRIAVMRRK